MLRHTTVLNLRLSLLKSDVLSLETVDVPHCSFAKHPPASAQLGVLCQDNFVAIIFQELEIAN